jgi:hypothetical protein
MINRVLDWVIGREPVATATGLAGGVAAILGLLAAFDVYRPTPEQVAAIGAFVAWLAGWLARRAVSPVTSPAERQLVRVKKELADEARAARGFDTVADDSRINTDDHGGVALGLLLFIAFVIVGGMVCVASLNEDADAQETPPVTYHIDPPPPGVDISEPAVVDRLPETAMAPMDNEPCSGEGACQGRQKRGCAEAQAPCSDDDNIVIIICPQPGSCDFSGSPKEGQA